MKCPIDGDVLRAGKAEAHTGYGCASCRGSWLPKSYVDSIQYTKEFDPQKFFNRLSSTAKEVTSIICPVNCGQLSSVTDYYGVSYCPNCSGIWFEKNALKNMLSCYQDKKDNAVYVDVPNATAGIFDLFLGILK